MRCCSWQLPSSCRRTRAPTAPCRRRGDRHSGRSAGRRPCRCAHGEVIGNRDRLAVRDQEAVEVALAAASMSARAPTRPAASDRSPPCSRSCAPAVAREMFFVRAPAQLAGLRALADEAVDRPGVDELAAAACRDSRPACRARSNGSTFTPSCIASRAQSSLRSRHVGACLQMSRAMLISACLTQCEISPGLAPCVGITVGTARIFVVAARSTSSRRP